ncbi:hypothetical protein [Streptomyces mesophilus]|uniref:hypothetical protein n=1 Tax=Streptomyces mesophilus TaxID=1775132 RepID=UPI0038B6A370
MSPRLRRRAAAPIAQAANAVGLTALAHFARDLQPLGAERRAAFEELLAAQLAQIETAIHRS